MTAYETTAETVCLGEMGGYEGEIFQWDAIYESERVLPFANIRQRD